MPKEKGKEEEVETIPEEVPVEEVPTEETLPKTFTQEELDAEKEQVRQEELGKYQGIQRTIAKKDKRIQELEGQPQVRGDTRLLSKMLDELEKGGEEFSDAGRATRIASLRAEISREEGFAKQEAVVAKQRGDINRQIYEAGFTPDDEMFDGVWDSFRMGSAIDGNFDPVHKRLDRVLAKQEKGKTETKTEATDTLETLKAKVAAMEEEQNRKTLEEEGKLVSEAGSPSAGSRSGQQVLDDVIEGKTSFEDAKKRGAKFI